MLIKTYETYILTVLTYGQELLIGASDSVMNILEKVQNKALRLITGGVKTNPIASMEMVTGIRPLKYSRECAAMKIMERITRVPSNLFTKYKPVENTLKSKVSLIDNTKTIYEKYGLDFPENPRKFTSSKYSRQADKRFQKQKAKISEAVDTEIRNHHDELAHQKCWQGLCKTSIKTKRRKEFIANFRRKTAHDLLNQHLNRFGLVPSPLCDLCQEKNETSSHMYECKAITDCTDVMKQLFKNEEELFSEIYWHFRSLKNS